MQHPELNHTLISGHSQLGLLFDVEVVNLKIRDSCAQLGAPVDQPVCTEDDPLVLHAYECLVDCL